MLERTTSDFDATGLKSSIPPIKLMKQVALNSGMSYVMRNFIAVKGDLPPALPVKGKVTVVEAWATWCPPCRAAIPHLSALQLEFKDDLVVFGVAQESWEPEQKVQPFVDSMGDNMNYTVLCLKSNCEQTLPVDFKDIEFVPHALVYGRDGALKFRGSPNDHDFDEKLRFELSVAPAPCRAVFLQATNLPRMDITSASDPFCAIFVRNPSKHQHDRWAMCSFGPYFSAQNNDEVFQSKGEVGAGRAVLPDKRDPSINRNLLMTTEVLRNCNDPVWSNPLIFDLDVFDEPSKWEVLFAVYDHV